MQFLFPKASMPRPDQILPGRSEAIVAPGPHHVNGHPLAPPYPDGIEIAEFGMGCFWGAEKAFWSIPGVWVTAVGYQGGETLEPDVPRGLHRQHGPRRGRARGLRPLGRPL